MGRFRQIGLAAGPLAALLLLLFADLEPGHPEVTRAAAVAVLMAIWWVTEAIPIPATALIPMALFPLLGVLGGRDVAASYFNNVIFLFIGGFIIALSMERWNLHRRIALFIIMLLGTSPRRILLGFMCATAFLSMWISNTATAMMMVPMALAILAGLRDTVSKETASKFGEGLLIGIAYAASIGGMATLVGTPPNIAFIRIFAIQFPNAPEISFAQWFLFGLPFSIVFLAIAWLVLEIAFVRHVNVSEASREVFRAERKRLGKPSFEEKVIFIAFVLVAVLWIFRADLSFGLFPIPGWSSILPVPKFIDDGVIAIAISLILFVIPSRSKPGQRLMDWETATKLHWGIVILFGGGFALAAAFESSGLSSWIAGQLAALQGAPTVLIVMTVCTMLTFLTELTSNTATTQLILPLLASLSVALHIHPLLFMIPATLSASAAFMLPVATPPNAIVFGSGAVHLGHMARVGIIMNLIGVVLITAVIYLLGPAIFGVHPSTFPPWAVQ